MPRITGPNGKIPHEPSHSHSTFGIPSPEGMMLPKHAEKAPVDNRKLADIHLHVAPHSTLGEVIEATKNLNTTQAASLALFVALGGGTHSKVGHTLLKHSKHLNDSELPSIVLATLGQTMVEEGYKP